MKQLFLFSSKFSQKYFIAQIEVIRSTATRFLHALATAYRLRLKAKRQFAVWMKIKASHVSRWFSDVLNVS